MKIEGQLCQVSTTHIYQTT